MIKEEKMNSSRRCKSLRAAPVILLTFTTLLIVGCRGKRDTVVVAGKVTFDGRLVSNGDIRFLPTQGTGARASGAPIIDGVYEAKYKGGVPIGTHRVVIRAFMLEGIGSAAGSGPVAEDLVSRAPQRSKEQRKEIPLPIYVVEGREQFLPGEFNVQSKLELTVTGENATQTADFELSSKGS